MKMLSIWDDLKNKNIQIVSLVVVVVVVVVVYFVYILCRQHSTGSFV